MLLHKTKEQESKPKMMQNKVAPWEGNIPDSVSFRPKKKQPSCSRLKAESTQLVDLGLFRTQWNKS